MEPAAPHPDADPGPLGPRAGELHDTGVGTAMEDVQVLQQGLLYDSADGSIGVVYVWGATPDGRAAQVVLSVRTPDGQEREYDLGLGDRFPLGSALWEVHSVDPDEDGYSARIVRVDE